MCGLGGNIRWPTGATNINASSKTFMYLQKHLCKFRNINASSETLMQFQKTEITSSVSKITFVVAEITFKVVMSTSLREKYFDYVPEKYEK